MGRTGSALDNAVAESFNSTLEWELLRNNHFQTRGQARHAVAGWIEDYNSARTAFHQRHAQPHRLRTRLRSTTQHRVRQRSGGGINQMEAASPPLTFPLSAVQATGPPLQPQGSLPRSLRDGSCGPPLTP